MTDLSASRILHDPPLASLAEWTAVGGGAAIALAREDGPAAIARISEAGLRGRGGAGFPTGRKWGSIAGATGQRRFVVCNAAEGEPGTFKDRSLMRANPFAVVEGLVAAAHAVGATEAYIALKESFTPELISIRDAATAMERAGWFDGVEVRIATGPEEYLFGEEKALLEVIEGNEPLPRWLPPYLHGLFATAPQLGWESTAGEPGHSGPTPAPGANPTLVNNAETLAQAAWILANGADAFRSVGTTESPGTVICTVVGDVGRSGVTEVPMGTPLSAVIAAAGGVSPGHSVKAVLSGVATAPLTGGALDTPLSYEGFEAAGSGLGAAGLIVYDDTACMVEVAAMVSRFLSVESCGQCLPCKLGTGAITDALDRIRIEGGTTRDLDVIQERLHIVTDGNRCYLPVQEQILVSGLMQTFPEDFAAHLDGWCPSDRTDYPVPKIVDIEDGIAVFDVRQARKRPDWTYADA